MLLTAVYQVTVYALVIKSKSSPISASEFRKCRTKTDEHKHCAIYAPKLGTYFAREGN